MVCILFKNIPYVYECIVNTFQARDSTYASATPGAVINSTATLTIYYALFIYGDWEIYYITHTSAMAFRSNRSLLTLQHQSFSRP